MSTGVPARSVTELPAGIWTASQSRVSSTEVTLSMTPILICGSDKKSRKNFPRFKGFNWIYAHNHLDSPMRKLEWQQTIQASTDPQRAKHGFDQLKAAGGAGLLRQASPEDARILAALFSGSQALGQLLLKHPDWLPQTLDAEMLRHPRQEQGLRREVDGWLGQLLSSRDYATALTRLRLFKQREMLRVAARDLARLGNTTEITREISDVADVCLEAVYQVCRRQFTER